MTKLDRAGFTNPPFFKGVEMLEVILLQHMIFSDRRYRAAETIVMGEALAQKLIESGLAVAVPQIDEEPVTIETDTEEPVKKPVRRTTKKG